MLVSLDNIRSQIKTLEIKVPQEKRFAADIFRQELNLLMRAYFENLELELNPSLS